MKQTATPSFYEKFVKPRIDEHYLRKLTEVTGLIRTGDVRVVTGDGTVNGSVKKNGVGGTVISMDRSGSDGVETTTIEIDEGLLAEGQLYVTASRVTNAGGTGVTEESFPTEISGRELFKTVQILSQNPDNLEGHGRQREIA